ncbi:MAG: twin-arginine translocase subunit TatC [Muribaculaceae bacterium]|nr:twin-arginine translocase subunit TatC [Muribaculaceae bacterium]
MPETLQPTPPRLSIDQPTEGEEMTFWGHLNELRSVMVKIVLLLIILMVGMFCVMRPIFEHVILAPCSNDFIIYRMFDFMHGDGDILPDLASDNFNVTLINIKLGTQLMTHMSASFWLAIIIAFPIVIYMLWSFVSPGLFPNERRGARRAFIYGNMLFYFGVAVGYFLVFPLALRFLSEYQLSERIANTITLDSYMDTFYLVTMSMGILFELPLLMWFLGKIGIVDREFFKRYRKYAIVSILIISGIITPTSDLFTLFIVFSPLYSLWELSAFLVPRLKRQTSEQQ